MRKLYLLAATLCSTLAHASDYIDDALIADIARKEKVAISEVKKSLEEGCSSGITPYMRQCAYFHAVGADIQLNKKYQSLLKQLNSPLAKAKLIKAQRIWITFRDASCEYESVGWTGGTGYGVTYSGCIASMAEERTKQLNEYLSCDGSTCPSSL